MVSLTAEMLPQVITVIGTLAFTVSVITEVIKGLSFMRHIPTDLVVIILSLILSVAAFYAYAQYTGLAITWYLVVAAFIGGFFVAFIAMYGWSKLSGLWGRFNPSNKDSNK